MSRIVNTTETLSRLEVTPCKEGLGETGEWLLMGTSFLSKVIKMFENEMVVIVVQICKYTEIHQIVHFKWVNVIVYKLYLNKAGFCQTANLYEFLKAGPKAIWWQMGPGIFEVEQLRSHQPVSIAQAVVYNWTDSGASKEPNICIPNTLSS